MIKDIFMGLFFPNKCLICGEHLGDNRVICDNCLPEKAQIRFYNIKYGRNRYFFQCESLYKYDGYYKHCMNYFKFMGKIAYSEKFVEFASMLLNLDEISMYDYITFVPAFKGKRKRRRYNQSKVLAEELSKFTGVKVVTALEKTINNKVQHRLKAKDRRENVKNVYKSVFDVKGQNILIVDDIITTGSTISECARVLLKAGAKGVKGICFAHRNMELRLHKEK